MTSLDTATTTIQRPDSANPVDPAHLAAAAFLARDSSRTLDADRHDLRGYFNWAASIGLAVLEATRPHIELHRGRLAERGLAASTIDRRLSTVCGFYRFAHIDGRIASNPAQYVRRPQVHPFDGRGLDRTELARFLLAAERCDHDHSALAVLLGLNGLRVGEACDTNIEDLGVERGHRTLGILGKGNKPAVIPLVPRPARTRNSPLFNTRFRKGERSPPRRARGSWGASHRVDRLHSRGVDMHAEWQVQQAEIGQAGVQVTVTSRQRSSSSRRPFLLATSPLLDRRVAA